MTDDEMTNRQIVRFPADGQRIWRAWPICPQCGTTYAAGGVMQAGESPVVTCPNCGQSHALEQRIEETQP